MSKQTILLTKIATFSPTPVEMFQSIIDKIKPTPLIANLATVDKEFGVLNRTIIYRGLTKDQPQHICFVTERNSRKYENLKENPQLSLTIVCHSPEETWQIRLFNAIAEELNDEEVNKKWEEEPLWAKIRSNICESGKPNNIEELEKKYWEIMNEYEKDCVEPEQTKSYTSFKIIPKIWDFYRSKPNKIADRIQYKLIEGEQNKWQIYHVDP